MAISISGDTGISAVQDGIIVTADLANDAVTQAKIASGAVGSTELSSGAVGATQLASTLDLTGKTVTLPAGTGGKILQVVSTTKTDVFSTTTSSNTWFEITNLSATITPSSTSSKILVLFSVNWGSSTASSGQFRLIRGGSAIAIGDADGTRQRTTISNYSVGSSTGHNQSDTKIHLDSPSTTSATEYKIEGANENGTFYLNRTGRDGTGGADGRSISSITLIEVGA